jgi:hypothetical protein
LGAAAGGFAAAAVVVADLVVEVELDDDVGDCVVVPVPGAAASARAVPVPVVPVVGAPAGLVEEAAPTAARAVCVPETVVLDRGLAELPPQPASAITAATGSAAQRRLIDTDISCLARDADRRGSAPLRTRGAGAERQAPRPPSGLRARQ